jgi:SPP1 gp7 family putative phage head morphogenesis protein
MLARDEARARRPDRAAFAKVRRAEVQYARQLRSVGRHVGQIIRVFPIGDVTALPAMQDALGKYADAITPWATAVAEKMLADVARRDKNAWKRHSADMSRALQLELENAPTGAALQALLHEQVVYIRSLPIEAGERVHDLTVQGMLDASRAKDIAREIARSGEVTVSRANLIARTEVARTASGLVEARAVHVGSEGYIWRTAEDSDVRKEHAKLNGKFIRWDSPPIAGPKGERYHAGQGPNCFAGSTIVNLANGCHHIWRRMYFGPMIALRFDGGVVEVTPNHPLLTARGWLPAEAINEQDELIQCEAHRALAVDENENQRQTTLAEVFDALRSIVPSEAAPGFLFNFHGDIPKEDVDTIRADHLLPGDRITATVQLIGEQYLARPDGRILNQDIVCGGSHVGETDGTRCLNELASSGETHLPHAEPIGSAAVAPFNAIAFQQHGDRPSGAGELSGEAQFAFAGHVARDNSLLGKVCASVLAGRNSARYHDATSPEFLAEIVRVHADSAGGVNNQGAPSYKALRVVDKRIRDFAGHVFTMETKSGWFSVTHAAVVSKNCRCYPDPQIPDFRAEAA